MKDHNPATDVPRGTDYADSVIEATVPAKKPADDLPSDSFFDGTGHKPAYPTGVSETALDWRVEGIHVLGGLHGNEQTIERLDTALDMFDPDIVAVEACHQAVYLHHPDRYEPERPLEDEVEAAACAAHQTDSLSVAGIDVVDWRWRQGERERFAEIDAEIFTELGVIDAPEELTLKSYYEVDLSQIHEWRERTEDRIPDLFRKVLATREDAMAGALHELYQDDSVTTVVAVVGVQHLTGILDRLQAPYLIPDARFERPPVYSYADSELDGIPFAERPSRW